jgi:AcrR family transcriptional regulator
MSAQLNSLNRAGAAAATSSRDEIVRAAIPLFAAKGFEGTTVKEIADASGLNVSLVSYYFGSKLGLFEYCLRSFGEGRLLVVEKLLRSPESPEDFRVRFRLLYEQMLLGHLENPDMTLLLHRELGNGMQICRDVFQSVYARILVAIESFVAAAKQNGFVRDSVDPHLTAQIMWVGFISFLRDDHVNRTLNGDTVTDPEYRKRLLDQMFALYWGGILK